MHYESPWSFMLLLLIPALLWLRRKSARGGIVRFPATEQAIVAGSSWRSRVGWLTVALRVMALICLVVALARPREGTERARDINHGIAMEMVLDRSGSMGQPMEYKGEQLNRLEVVKRIFGEFVAGDKHGLPGRPNDLIGMITFARYPDTTCPLTLAHGALPKFLETVRLADRQSEDGTSIGDAIALAAARLKTAEETLARLAGKPGRKKDYEIKSKVIILLTDGENNAGKRSPAQAAKLAAQWGQKIYAIGVGGVSMMSFQTPFGVFSQPTASNMDEGTLRGIAESTGGRFWKADNAESLREIYKEINKLEKSEIESVRFIDYKERFAAFALAALFLLVAEIILSATLFRRIP